jgi:hypothetical protein
VSRKLGDVNERETSNGTPRWVKVFGIIAVIVIVVFVVVLVTRGAHGPGRHTQAAVHQT